jgi:hypothetical protein
VDTSASSSVQWFARADRTLSSQPAALEVAVEVSGTHAKAGAATRELFSESTVTTLIFEDGVVVRLSAAVVDGQLLFLKHSGSQKEIVTRVLRQRSLGSASTYVELEFTDAVPGFWGSALDSARRETVEESAADVAAREFLAGDVAEPEPQITAAMPDEGEVKRLREEVAGLRSRMSSMLTPDNGAKNEAPAPMPATVDMSSVITALLGAAPSLAKAANAETAEKPASRPEPSPMQAEEELYIEEDLPAEEASSPESAVAPTPRFKVTPRIRLLAALLLLALVGAAAYQKGALGNWIGKPSVTALAAGAPDAPVASGGTVDPAADAAGAAAVTGSGKPQSDGAAADAARKSDGREAVPVAMHQVDARENHDSGAGTEATDSVAAVNPERNSVLEKRGNHRSVALHAPDAAAISAPDVAEEGYEPPSLVKSVTAVPPPEAVRDFVTGDVKFDAVVDATGKVASANAISGPGPLRSAALEALHGYQYKAATRNGQAVSGHVMVTVKFWYEP